MNRTAGPGQPQESCWPRRPSRDGHFWGEAETGAVPNAYPVVCPMAELERELDFQRGLECACEPEQSCPCHHHAADGAWFWSPTAQGRAAGSSAYYLWREQAPATANFFGYARFHDPLARPTPLLWPLSQAPVDYRQSGQPTNPGGMPGRHPCGGLFWGYVCRGYFSRVPIPNP